MINTLNGKRNLFVSFNQADRTWATWIAWALEAAGYSVFFQDWDFKSRRHRARIPWRVEQAEVQRQVKARTLLVAVEAGNTVGRPLDLARQNPVRKLVDDLAQVGKITERLRAVVGEDAPKLLRRRHFVVVPGVRWIIAQEIVLGEHGARVYDVLRTTIIANGEEPLRESRFT